MKAHHTALTTKDESLFKENKALFLLPDINFSQLWKCKLTKATKNAIWKYLHVLLLVVSHYEVQNVTQKMVQRATHADATDDTDAIENTSSLDDSANAPPTPNMQETFEQWNTLLDSNQLSDEDMQKMKEQSENIMKLMQNLHNSQDDNDVVDEECDETEREDGSSSNTTFADIQNDPFVKKLEGSKIAQFAKELSTELDMNDLGLSEDAKMDSFQDVFGMMGKDPQKLFVLVQTVGNKIQSKMQHGDIQQNELVAEAHDLMQSMQGSQAFKNMFKPGKRKGGGLDPHTLFKEMSKHMNFDPSQIDPAMMQQAMAMMGGMGANMPAGGATRSRLQSKLAQKQQHTDTCTQMSSTVSTTEATLPVKKKKNKKKKKKTVQHPHEPSTTD